MTPPQPTPALLVVARRVAAHRWTLGPNDDYSPTANPNLNLLHEYGFVYVRFAANHLRQDVADEDRWALTLTGRDWLAEHDTEAKETR